MRAISHFFWGHKKGMYSFSTKISSFVELSIFQPALPSIQIFSSGGTSGNAVLIWIEQFRSCHLLKVSFSLCDSALLRCFELLLHPQPTILSISTIVRPIGWKVLILSVSIQSKVLRRFRLFEFLVDLEIGLLEHWLFGR